MKYFYSPQEQHLIAVPQRCGTNVFMRVIRPLELIFLDTRHNFSYNTYLEAKLPRWSKQKTMFVRDPFDRFLSVFNAFVFNKTPESFAFLKFRSEKRSDNLFEDILFCLPLIQQYYTDEIHFRPYSRYFKDLNESITDYNLVHMDDINRWLYLTFGYENTRPISTSRDSYKVNISDRQLADELHCVVKKLYSADYELFNQTVRLCG